MVRSLEHHGYNLESIVTITEMVAILLEEKLISSTQKQAVEKFMQMDLSSPAENLNSVLEKSKNPMTKKLVKNILQKESNLVISLDVDNQNDFFRILTDVADEIVMVKTHVDILQDFDEGFVYPSYLREGWSPH